MFCAELMNPEVQQLFDLLSRVPSIRWRQVIRANQGVRLACHVQAQGSLGDLEITLSEWTVLRPR